jgi:hypothetical protein
VKDIVLKKNAVDLEKFVHRRANESDFTTLIKEEFRLIDQDSGKIVALYVKPKKEKVAFSKIFRACKQTKFTKDTRTSGLVTTSSIFGYAPRNPIRGKPYCSSTRMANEQREQHDVLMDVAAPLCARNYKEHHPDLYAEHMGLSKKIVSDYRDDETPFTSGIINDNNPLCYHFDSGNFESVWSAMIVLKDRIAGGYLSMPEYGIGVEVANNSIFYFDGQGILHGVTPIKKLHPEARRFSIVFYSLKRLWSCLPLSEEIARAKQMRTEFEDLKEKKKIQ